MMVICIQCNKAFNQCPSKIKIGRGKYCSNTCKYSSKKMKDKISRALTGRKLSKEHTDKVKIYLSSAKDQRGKNNLNYKHGLTNTKDYKRMIKHNYKMRKKQITIGHSLEEWQKLKETYQYICLCCKRQEPEITLTEDHIVPLSKGGTDDIWNIQPLCSSCNTRKYTNTISYRKGELV